MKISKLVTLAVVPAILLGCRTDDDRVDDTWTDPALTTEPAAPEQREVREETLNLDEVAGSGVSGEAEVREAGAQAQVLVRINDGGPNVTYAGGVYRGTCEMPGERVAELQAITTQQDGTGQGMSTVSIPGWGTGMATGTATPQDPATTTDPATGTTAQPGTTTATDQLVVAYHRGDQAPESGMQPVVCGELRGDRGTTGW